MSKLTSMDRMTMFNSIDDPLRTFWDGVVILLAGLSVLAMHELPRGPHRDCSTGEMGAAYCSMMPASDGNLLIAIIASIAIIAGLAILSLPVIALVRENKNVGMMPSREAMMSTSADNAVNDVTSDSSSVDNAVSVVNNDASAERNPEYDTAPSDDRSTVPSHDYNVELIDDSIADNTVDNASIIGPATVLLALARLPVSGDGSDDGDARPSDAALAYAFQLVEWLREAGIALNELMITPTDNHTIEVSYRVDRDNELSFETGANGISGNMYVQGDRIAVSEYTDRGITLRRHIIANVRMAMKIWNDHSRLGD